MDAEKLLNEDGRARVRIKTELDRNFFVEASAGSGKTFSLVERMTAMAEQGVDVSRICAITFTKAAANEFYRRFHKKLAIRSAEETDPQKKANLTRALKQIDLCFMGTIDAFCSQILSEHPAEARIPTDAAVMSEDEEAAAYAAAFSKIAKGEYGEELQAKYRSFCKNHYFPKKTFTKLMTQLAGWRNAEYVVEDGDPLPELAPERRKEEKTRLLRLLGMIEQQGNAAVYQRARDNVKAFSDYLNQAEQLRMTDWERDPKAATKILGKIKKLRLIKDCPIAALPDFSEWFTEGAANTPQLALEEQCGLYRWMSRQCYERSVDFLISAVPVVTEELRSQGRLTYFDALLYLRDMLRDDIRRDGRLTRHIAERHSIFLIDEFQDTNPLQAEVFFYLAAQEPVEDWTACRPRPGSLFIVGDPKQSIYRFRGADVGAFMKVRELFAADEIVTLSRNFRSTREICDWFNGVFPQQFPAAPTEMQSSYPLIPTQENPVQGENFGGVMYYCTRDDKDALPEDADTARVGSIIERLVGWYSIKTPDDPAPRPIRFSDFMIILPRKKRLKNYVDELAQRNIPARVEGVVTFSRCPSLRMLSAIYSAAAISEDSTRIYTALRIGYRISESDIEAYLRPEGQDCRYLSLYGIPEDAEGAAADALRELKDFSMQADRLPPVAVLGNIRQSRELFRSAGADSLEYYYYAIELLRDAESTGTVNSAADAAVFLETLLTDGSGHERSLSLQRASERDCVHVANLHKVKGLEAPIVILADPSNLPGTPGVHIEDTDEGKQCRILEMKVDNFAEISTKGFSEARDNEKKQLAEENVRLRYVGATRAGNALIVSDKRISKGTKSSDASVWYPLLSRIDADFFEICPDRTPNYTAIQQDIGECYDADHRIENIDSVQSPSFELRKPSEQKSHAAATQEDTPEELPAEETDALPEETPRGHSDDGLTAAQRGTAVHRLMELLVSSKNRIDIDAAVKQILNEQEITDPRPAQTLRQVAQTVRTGGYPQRNGSVQDILPELLAADEVYCEVPFCMQQTDGELPVLTNGIMDLVYRKDGAWHIVDYKTNENADDLEAVYREQLAAYVSAFRALTGETADARIYHIDC